MNWIDLMLMCVLAVVLIVQEMRLRSHEEAARLREDTHREARKDLGDKLALYAQVRDTAVALDLAQSAYAQGRNSDREAELLFAVRRAERGVVEAALEVVESNLTFGEAMVVARMGKTIGRRSRPSMVLRWSADALEMRATPAPGGRLGPMWIDYEPTREDRAATDWIRRSIGTLILAHPFGSPPQRGRVLS